MMLLVCCVLRIVSSLVIRWLMSLISIDVEDRAGRVGGRVSRMEGRAGVGKPSIVGSLVWVGDGREGVGSGGAGTGIGYSLARSRGVAMSLVPLGSDRGGRVEGWTDVMGGGGGVAEVSGRGTVRGVDKGRCV